MKKLGIYIHIPFCRQKCGYCDFYSVKFDEESESRYVGALIKEIKYYKELLSLKYTVDTVYFGGGTPSILSPSNIIRITECLNASFSMDGNSEISMEANPNTFTEANLHLYKKAGINRLSIGIQSLNDTILQGIGRLHDSREALEAIDISLKKGFENINADVMFNIPGQTVEDIRSTLNQIAERGVKHVSFYSLKLEKGTPMFDMEKNHKIIMPDEEEERGMYYAGREVMEKNNLPQYEISNFAMKDYQCRHNLKYWQQEEYLGLGPSAHSFLNNRRFSSASNIRSYINDSEHNNFNKIVHEVLGRDDLIFENIMLNLRLTRGIDIDGFNKKFNLDFKTEYKNQIKYLVRNELLECKDGNIKLTKRGMDLSNHVFQQFMQ